MAEEFIDPVEEKKVIEDEPEEVQEKPKKKGTLKERYQNDPEYRKKHLEKMTEKVECECGKVVSRVNMNAHKKSQVHVNYEEKEEMKRQLKEKDKIECPCGVRVLKANVSTHKKTARHQKYEEAQQQEPENESDEESGAESSDNRRIRVICNRIRRSLNELTYCVNEFSEFLDNN